MERISHMTWTGDASGAAAGVSLMREYLRRSAVWAEALHDKEHWRFIDLPKRLAPGLALDSATAAKLHEIMDRHHLTSLVRQLCDMALRWSLIVDRPETKAFGLPDPYEPLLQFFEAHGAFTVEHGFIDLDGAALPIRTWAENAAAPIQAQVSP